MAHTHPDPQTVADRTVNRWYRTAMMFFCLSVVLAVALFAVAKAYEDERNLQGTCQVWHDLAELPLAPTTGQTGLQLVADGRNSYERLSCAGKLGELPPADPRVQAILDKNKK